jgi:hypothetical protein
VRKFAQERLRGVNVRRDKVKDTNPGFICLPPQISLNDAEKTRDARSKLFALPPLAPADSIISAAFRVPQTFFCTLFFINLLGEFI